jgi:hypothetical protein
VEADEINYDESDQKLFPRKSPFPLLAGLKRDSPNVNLAWLKSYRDLSLSLSLSPFSIVSARICGIPFLTGRPDGSGFWALQGSSLSKALSFSPSLLLSFMFLFCSHSVLLCFPIHPRLSCNSTLLLFPA